MANWGISLNRIGCYNARCFRLSLLWICAMYSVLILLSDNMTLAHEEVSNKAPIERYNKKIAFLFMTRGHMPLEAIWHEFFRWRGNSSLYSVYIHPHHGFTYPEGSLFHGKEVRNKENVKWGGMSQVRGIRLLVQEALKDPDNEWFCMMSESCIPLLPFPKFRNALMNHDKSIINACAMDIGEMELPTRWRDTLFSVGMKKEYWRKSATWFALQRKHAIIFANETHQDAAWESVPCCDEHYLPSLLAMYGQDNETSCTDGFVYVNWPSLIASHPRTFVGDDINPEFFASIQRPIANHRGFGMQCSGVKDICHFTARKFASTTKYHLLENIDIILSEDDHPYSGNPWDHHSDKIRRTANYSNYYLIENNLLRLIPDNTTAYYMHINLGDATVLSNLDLTDYKIGPNIPSRTDGLLYKSAKQRQIYAIQKGHRHAIPNMDTFLSMGLKLENVIILQDADVDQITIGDVIPDVNKKDAAKSMVHLRN